MLFPTNRKQCAARGSKTIPRAVCGVWCVVCALRVLFVYAANCSAYIRSVGITGYCERVESRLPFWGFLGFMICERCARDDFTP